MNKTGGKLMNIYLILVITFFCLSAAGSVSGRFTVKASDAEFVINTKNPLQGSLIKLAAPLKLKEGKILFADNTYSFHKEGDKAVALLPVSYWIEEGEYTLSIVDSQGETYKKWSLNVQAGEFPDSYLTVDKENQEKVKPTDPKRQKRQKREQKIVYKARSESSSKRLWEESFQWPVKGRISTEFGATRYHNGELANRHSGIDIAVMTGIPVKAANSGRVVLARDLLRTGKTIIIDHGWNVFSAYLHLSELRVEEEEEVNRGEVIGLVGETGFATGPHLHWSISIGRTFVNPRDFLELEL